MKPGKSNAAALEDIAYPGEAATPEEILCLADEYRRASKLLQNLGCRGEPLSFAPFRLTILHAIELYLNALLRRVGKAPPEIRSMQHDLALRTKAAVDSGLKLRQRTVDHLQKVVIRREYLTSRYETEMTCETSQVTELTATLEDIAKMVHKFVDGR
ncbi:MAG TPA: hypothetical protein VMU01_04570 [Rhizomicrobium sp.]|nr:hypothetical protein [Rhizomicrobium sp.]